MKTTPGSFEGFEVFVMHDQIDLLGELSIDLCHDCFDGTDRVLGDQAGTGERLLGQCFYRGLDSFLCRIAFRLELFVEKIFEFVDLRRRCGRRSNLSLWITRSHALLLAFCFLLYLRFWRRS